MLSRLFFFVISAVFCVFSTAAQAQSGAGGRVSDVRFGQNSDMTRVVVDSDIRLDYEYFTLANGSMRLVIDMPRIRWTINGQTSEAGSGAGTGVVRQYRYGHNSASTSRLVLDLDQPARVVSREYIKPKGNNQNHRIVLDLEATDYAVFAKYSGAPEHRDDKNKKRQRRKPLIVIDAGHGGRDPGAIGVGGHKEKDVNLSAAFALKDALTRTNRYDVALTRDHDEFIELEDRVDRARGYKADLFISLHADAGAKSHTRGASVYTLSSSGAKRAERIRESQNWILDIEKDDTRSTQVQDILVDLAVNETKNRSSEFAQTLIPQINKAGWPTVQRTHRDAGFFVLLAPDVPAVLLEMGFMTNASDEALLTSGRQRRKLINAIVESIDIFFSEEELYVAQR